MKQDNQLSLCDPHNCIIHEYGCESSCTKTAAICRKGCSQYEHKQKVSKHQFIHAREVYTIVSHLRQDYAGFSTNFKEVYLKRYISEISQALKTFQENVFAKINSQNSLVDIYSRNSGQIFQTILEDKCEDIQFSQLKCKQVFQLKCFHNTLTKSNQEEQEKRVMKILMRMFEQHLRNLKLIPLPVKPQKQQKKKRLFIIEGGNIQQVIQTTKQSVKSLETKGIPQGNEELLIKIKERLNEQRDGSEIRTKLDAFFESQHNLFNLIKFQELTLAVKGIVSASPFWVEFINFVGREKIRSLKVITSDQTQESKSLQNEILMMNKQKFSIKFVTANWEKVENLSQLG